jgi:hypothetical protein
MTASGMDRQRLVVQTDCPVCGGAAPVVATVRTIDSHSEDRLKLRRCAACRHLFHDPIPAQDLLSELYAAGSPLVVPSGYGGTSPSNERQLQRTLRRVLSDAPSLAEKSVLELGSGNGAFIRWMHARARRATGIEPGRWHEELTYIVPSLADVPNGTKYDLIIALDVLEHLADPIGMLRDLRSLASDTAVISCTFPNADSLTARWLRARWRMIRPYGHLHYFSARSTAAAFAQGGWTVNRRVKTWYGFSGLPHLRTAVSQLAHGRLKQAAGTVLLGLFLGRDQWFVQASAAKLGATASAPST